MLFCIQPIRHTVIDSHPVEPLTFATCPELRFPFFSRPRLQRRRRLRKRYLGEQKQEPAMAAASVDVRAASRSNLSMVGSLDQPPPAYENASRNSEHKSQPRQEFVHMKTTQTVTVTTQMIVPLPRSATAETRDPHLDCSAQTGTQRPPRGPLMLNKDLPPPPAPANDPDVYTNRQAPLVPLPATFALAHAALGLGLPSALPQPPRVSISGPPTNPTIQLVNDVGSDKGPLARLRAGARTNGATVETSKQRTRFISLGVRPMTAPVTVSNESQLSVERTPRTSNSAFGKKVRRAKSFTDRLRSAVGSP